MARHSQAPHLLQRVPSRFLDEPEVVDVHKGCNHGWIPAATMQGHGDNGHTRIEEGSDSLDARPVENSYHFLDRSDGSDSGQGHGRSQRVHVPRKHTNSTHQREALCELSDNRSESELRGSAPVPAGVRIPLNSVRQDDLEPPGRALPGAQAPAHFGGTQQIPPGAQDPAHFGGNRSRSLTGAQDPAHFGGNRSRALPARAAQRGRSSCEGTGRGAHPDASGAGPCSVARDGTLPSPPLVDMPQRSPREPQEQGLGQSRKEDSLSRRCPDPIPTPGPASGDGLGKQGCVVPTPDCEGPSPAPAPPHGEQVDCDHDGRRCAAGVTPAQLAGGDEAPASEGLLRAAGVTSAQPADGAEAPASEGLLRAAGVTPAQLAGAQRLRQTQKVNAQDRLGLPAANQHSAEATAGREEARADLKAEEVLAGSDIKHEPDLAASGMRGMLCGNADDPATCKEEPSGGGDASLPTLDQ
ncbi:hypothetical protein CYMTET_35333, partial [Cymbomonas tetramitiformis]